MRPRHPQVEEYLQRMDALPSRTLCALCDWEYEGTSLEGREKAAQHRALAHPDLVVSRRRAPSHLTSFRQPTLKKAEWKEIYAERDKRAKLLGIDISGETA